MLGLFMRVNEDPRIIRRMLVITNLVRAKWMLYVRVFECVGCISTSNSLFESCTASTSIISLFRLSAQLLFSAIQV